MKRHRKQQSQVLSEVENYHIDNILSGEFKDMYKNVQFNLRDFRNNIFSKNIDILDENVNRFRRIRKNGSIDYKNSDKEHMKKLRTFKSPSQLMEEYSKKANAKLKN